MAYRPPPIGPKTLSVTAPARRDIDEILDRLVREAGIGVALSFADRIDAELFRLADIGHGGVSRDWLSPGLRLTMIGRFSVYFRVTESETRIVRVLRGTQDLGEIDFDRGH